MITRIKGVSTAVILSILAVSCGEDAPPSAAPPQSIQQQPAVRRPAPSAPVAAAPAAAPAPAIPADAEFTILCMVVNGEDHAQIAQGYKEALVGTTGRKDVYLVNSDTETDVYCGFYRSNDRNDPDGRRAQADRNAVAALNFNGLMPFASALVVQLQDADPPAPAEWNLANLDHDKADDDPTRAYWSLQIAAFKDNRLRKQAAVEMVKNLRENQKVQAYFYHGESVSSVCVGSWPESAVEMPKDRPVAADETQMMPGNVAIPEEWRKRMEKHGVHAVNNVATIIDPTLIDMMKQFPAHAVNYEIAMHPMHDPQTRQPIIDPATHQPQLAPDPSFIVVIPRRQGTSTVQHTAGSETDPDSAQLQLTPGSDANDNSHLRSLGGGR